MQLYTAGFAFSKDANNVALIRKNRPAWQAGKLNAIGGHVEPGETPRQAQVREYYEETGVRSTLDDWTFFGRLNGGGTGMDAWQVNFYYSTNPRLLCVNTMTDEVVRVYDWSDISYFEGYPLMHNLRWLIERARDIILNPQADTMWSEF